MHREWGRGVNCHNVIAAEAGKLGTVRRIHDAENMDNLGGGVGNPTSNDSLFNL